MLSVGPGFWRTDLSLFKNMKFTERVTGQLRWETFNTFNHTNPICCASTELHLYAVQPGDLDPRSSDHADRHEAQLLIVCIEFTYYGAGSATQLPALFFVRG